jgi:hypothetical protein
MIKEKVAQANISNDMSKLKLTSTVINQPQYV